MKPSKEKLIYTNKNTQLTMNRFDMVNIKPF